MIDNNKAEKFEGHWTTVEQSQSVIDCLADNCPTISRQKLKFALTGGAVWLTQGKRTERIRRAKKSLSEGDSLHLYYDPDILFKPVSEARLIADEVDYSVWSKPAGMFSQGTKWGDYNSICRWVELTGLEQNGIAARPCFLVHRLDRATSGLILVAHKKKAASALAQLFELRQVEKHYRASVHGCLSQDNLGMVIQEPVDGKAAVTKILEINHPPEGGSTDLLLAIESGRKHQIRRHLSGLGYPIIGDRLYSASNDEESLHLGGKATPDLQLESCFLAFVSPFDKLPKQYRT